MTNFVHLGSLSADFCLLGHFLCCRVCNLLHRQPQTCNQIPVCYCYLVTSHQPVIQIKLLLCMFQEVAAGNTCTYIRKKCVFFLHQHDKKYCCPWTVAQTASTTPDNALVQNKKQKGGAEISDTENLCYKYTAVKSLECLLQVSFSFSSCVIV